MRKQVALAAMCRACLACLPLTHGAEQSHAPRACVSADRGVLTYVNTITCSRLHASADSVLMAVARPVTAVVRDVRSGELLVIARVAPDGMERSVDAMARIQPLSAVKLAIGALWLEHHDDAKAFHCLGSRELESTADVLVDGCDGAGKELAIRLRRDDGAPKILTELSRLGLAPDAGESSASDSAWAGAFSVGETGVRTTLLDLSSLMQVIGNDGVRSQRSRIDSATSGGAQRVMSVRTARSLQRALRRCVQEGTAKAIKDSLRETGWELGGKTGTGPGFDRPNSAGLFVSLLFDRDHRARYAIAIRTLGAGPGGGAAAQATVGIARILLPRAP